MTYESNAVTLVINAECVKILSLLYITKFIITSNDIWIL